MGKQRASKITISLPKDLLDLADRLAQERSTSRSGVIAELLDREEEARIHALMKEGYLAMAEENLAFAEETVALASEVLSEWK